MPAETYINIGGTPTRVQTNGIYVNVSGTWQQADFAYVNVGGTWQTVYVQDNVGPAAPTGCTATWTPSGLQVDWTNPADADHSYVSVYITPTGQPPIFGPNISGAPSGVMSYTFTTYIIDNTVYTVTLVPVDSNGNTGTPVSFSSMAWTGAARGRTPLTHIIDPIDSGNWRDGSWEYTMRPKQGASSAPGNNIGIFFYGTQFWDKLRGSTISAATIELFRANTVGVGGSVFPSMWTSTCSSRAENPGAGLDNPLAGTGMCRNGSCNPWSQFTVDAAWRARMAGYGATPRLNSVAMLSFDVTLIPGAGNVSASYMELIGALEVVGTVVPGRIIVTHSG
jgi:hypothetical protein